jgi:transposase-like protein/cytochrome c553
MRFTGENIVKFADLFSDDLQCLSYLADQKWANGFTCLKCGHTKFKIRKKNLARNCKSCHHIESPTAGAMFHKLRFGLRNAFGIIFEMSATRKGLSASQVAKRYGISSPIAWAFMHRVRIAMQSSMKNPIEGQVQVDEFLFGGKESLRQGRSLDSKKKKIVGAAELTETGKIKRTYFKKIEDYSSISLKGIFEDQISEKAKVFTDKWKGYIPLTKTYKIEQKYSEKGGSMKQLHTFIHQLKSWLRSTYSWVHKEHIEKYLDEYSFRINRSIFNQTIFDSHIRRMVIGKPITYQMIIISS